MTFDPDAPAAAGTLFGLPYSAEDARVVLLPVPWEATTSFRRGTKDGPKAALEASAQVDLHDLDTEDAWKARFAMLAEEPRVREWGDEAEADALAVIESGGSDPDAAARVDALSARVNHYVYQQVSRLLDDGKIPGVVGGDHSTPFGAIQAIAERYPGVGVLHIDAHADLREAYEGFTWSHASIFYNVMTKVRRVGHLTQVAIRDVGVGELAFQRDHADRISVFTDQALGRALAGGETWMNIVRRIVDTLPHDVYISFDVDGMDPSLCPSTGTPVPGGLSFRDVSLLLAEVAAARRIVGFDLNEIGPGDWDGNVAARLLLKMCGHAVRSQRA